MDTLELKILEILKSGTPLRAVKIAEMLDIERRQVNHYLYSSLKHLVVQDSNYRWSLKTNKIGNNQHIPTQSRQTQNRSSKPIQQDTSYRFTKEDIKQDTPIKSSISQTPPSQPPKRTNPYETVRKELTQVSSEEKVKILENAFRQDRFIELEDEEINALQTILEEAKREINIANTAYREGKLSLWKANRLAIAILSITLACGALFAINQLRFNSTYQNTPTIPQNK